MSDLQTFSLFQFPLFFAMLFLNFFADAQPKYVDLEGILIVFLVVRWAIREDIKKDEPWPSFLSHSASGWSHARGVCLLPIQDDLFLVFINDKNFGSLKLFSIRFFGFAWMGWKREILDQDLWSLTLTNRWKFLSNWKSDLFHISSV